MSNYRQFRRESDRHPQAGRSLPDWLLFFAKFLRHGFALSSLLPSSTALSRAFLRGMDWHSCRCVVELGAGTGPVTRAIIENAPPTCRTLFIERDPDFCRILRERFPNADIHEGDAASLGQILERRGIRQVDHVLCGLPLPALPQRIRGQVLGAVFACLSAEGTFRQLTHMPYVYQMFFQRYFRDVTFKFVFRNIPPAGYYICRDPRLDSLNSVRQ